MADDTPSADNEPENAPSDDESLDPAADASAESAAPGETTADADSDNDAGDVDVSFDAARQEDDGPLVADVEAEIRQELGIGGGKIEIDHTEVDRLLTEAVVGYEQVFAGTVLDPNLTTATATASPPAGISPGADVVSQNLGLLRDVNMKVKVELGRGRMFLKDILRLAQGSVVELERLAGDPLDIYVNDKVIARGEVLVLNENFCIRITEIFTPAEVLTQEV
ncbi:MAG: flagellar motor switch protein FliN [Planctomycetes bacterium]|nr:flagellar motor switch protein FliN [Planctomycetota bacterium]